MDITSGLKLIKAFEGCILSTYDDYNDKKLSKGQTPKGTPTIGWGMIESDYKYSGVHVWVNKTPYTITQKVADSSFEKLIKAKYVPLVDKWHKKYNWNVNQYNAMLSFVYNIGSLNGLTADGTRSNAAIAKKMLDYNKAGGRELSGLIRRRKAERDLFVKPVEEKKKTYTKLDKPQKHFTKGYAQRGDKGDFVKQVQKYLNWYFDKFCCLEDGKFGADTETYTKKLQKALGVSADGRFGGGTWNEAVYAKKKTATKKDKFLGELKYIHKYIKSHPSYFSYGEPSQASWDAIEKQVSKKKKVKITCVTPTRFALRKVGISNNLYVKNGKFTNKATLTNYFKFYESGHGIGYTLKEAVDKGLLKEGDIIGFSGITHTVCYYGGYYVIDGGTMSEKQKYKNGAKQDYSKGTYAKKKISAVARWK